MGYRSTRFDNSYDDGISVLTDLRRDGEALKLGVDIGQHLHHEQASLPGVLTAAVHNIYNAIEQIFEDVVGVAPMSYRFAGCPFGQSFPDGRRIMSHSRTDDGRSLGLVNDRAFSSDRPFRDCLLLFASCWFFLWVPDVDLALLPILHHRSIVTHSMLPALLLLALRRRLGLAPTIGALISVSVHLTCDALSPPTGFGQVWLPWPLKVPLGPLSPLWLLANAATCYFLALVMLRRLMGPYWALLATVVLAAVVGAGYGLLNENSLLAAGACLVLPALTAVFRWHRIRQA